MPDAVAEIRHAIETRARLRIEVVNHGKDGRRFVNEVSVSPVLGPDGGLRQFFGSQVDVTAGTRSRLACGST